MLICHQCCDYSCTRGVIAEAGLLADPKQMKCSVLGSLPCGAPWVGYGCVASNCVSQIVPVHISLQHILTGANLQQCLVERCDSYIHERRYILASLMSLTEL